MLPDLKVFISCAAEDIPLAKQLAKALANNGIESFISGERSELHTDLEIEARSALEDSYAFVLIASAKSLQSGTVKHELELARENHARKIIVLSFDGTTNPNYNFHYILSKALRLPKCSRVLPALYFSSGPLPGATRRNRWSASPPR